MPKSKKDLRQFRQDLKKHAAAIHIGADLSLVERKLANVLLLNAYDDLTTARLHTIPVQILCAMLGWDESNNVEYLQDAIRKLVNTPVEFNLMDDGKASWHSMALISYGKIEGGMCSYSYAEFLAEQLYNPEIYATINLRVQRLFDSAFALALYENCLRFRNVGSTGWWPLGIYRRFVGATSKIYDEFKYLNRNAIAKPVEEINRVSDIRLAPEFRRVGRKVVEIRFLISEAQQQDGPVVSAEKTKGADAQGDIRESDLFKKLRALGIGERLAISWMRQDEKRARKATEYVEAKARNKEVRGSTAGYLRTVFESGSELGPSEFEIRQKEQAREAAEARAREESEKKRRSKAEAEAADRSWKVVQALTPEQKAAFAQEWATTEAGKAARWDEERGDFKAATDRIGFGLWLRKRVAARKEAQETVDVLPSP